jgi:putative nucleotidyltransferase with HDIG domain
MPRSVQSGSHPQKSEAVQRVDITQQVEELKLELQQSRQRLRDTQLDTVSALVAAVEAKDPLTERHSVNVACYAERLAAPFGLSRRQMRVIKTAAMLHDIGKIGIPDAILMKPGALTQEEYRIVQEHPVTGAAILKSASGLQRELPLVLHHHEWYDGRGYPGRLRGEFIPFGARILHAADGIDAMLSRRSYKAGYSLDRVSSELRRGRGTQFDPIIADVALNWIRQSPGEVLEPTPVSSFHSAFCCDHTSANVDADRGRVVRAPDQARRRLELALSM